MVMNMDLLLFGRLSGGARVSACFVIGVSHPVHSVLSLILSFVSTCMLMMRLQIEFMSLIFVVVYVGAIAVLFLFVVMMLNLNTLEASSDRQRNEKEWMSSVSSGMMGMRFGRMRRQGPMQWQGIHFHQDGDLSHVRWVDVIDRITNLEPLGQVLYTVKLVDLVMAGFVLLVARVGAIVLTLQIRSFAMAKRQQVYQQRSRDSVRAVMMTRVS